MKKRIAYILSVLCLGFVCLCLPSCGGDDDDATEEAPYFNVSTITLSAKGVVPYTGNFTVNTNLQWQVKEKPSWVTLDAMEGKGKQDVGVTISTSDKNYRTGDIVIASSDKRYEKTIEVRQNGNTLSAVTGDYKGSKVTKGAFMGTDRKQYEYEHKITVEFSVNGSHLASEYGVTGSTIQGALSDGVHSTTVTVYSNRASTTFTYRAFATNKSTGEKVYGKENTIVSSSN